VTGLLRAEVRKLAGRKLYWILLAVLAGFVVMAAFFVLVFPRIAPAEAGPIPVIDKPDAYLVGVGQVASQVWFPVILAVVMLGTETGSSLWATNLTREPRRGRHLAAKTGVLGLAAIAGAVLGVLVWTASAAVWASGSGTPEVGDWVGRVAKLGLVELVWVSIGLAAAAGLRSVGPAVGVGLGFSFLDAVLAVWAPWRRWSPTWATSSLVDGRRVSDILGGGQMTPGEAALVLVLWCVLALVVAWAALRFREP
jgi:hypothetical protein